MAGWLALFVGIGLSPALAATAQALAADPWKLPALLVALLLLPLVRREREATRGLRLGGLLWIALAVALEILLIGSGRMRWARLSLGLGGFGWLRASRLASRGSAALALFCVPPPSLLSHATSPVLEGCWRGLAAAVLPGIEPGSFPLALHHGDGGLVPVLVGAAAGLYAMRRLGRGGAWAALRGLALGGVTGLVGQALGVVGAAAAAALLGPSAARRLLDLTPALLVLSGIVLWVELRVAALPAPSAEGLG